MLSIRTEDLGKKFQYEWIFKKVNLEFHFQKNYTIIGPNGSGKSTFLKVLAGITPPNLGKVEYQLDQKKIPIEQVYRQLVLAAPYLELVEEFTLLEAIRFHTQFKPLRDEINIKAFLDKTGLKKAKNKMIRYFSSGMKQRLKLGLAFYSNAPLLLLDEPTSNLDQQGVAWYQQEIQNCLQQRLVILCSNQPEEYEFCENIINIADYKVVR